MESTGRRRPTLLAAGLAAWGLVAVPTFLTATASPRFPAWLAAWLAFAAAWTYAAARRDASSRRAAPGAEETTRLDAATGAAVALAGGAVVGMVGLLCNGFEGMLLVVLSALLGRVASPAGGGAWIGVQTAAAGLAIALHWSPRSALLLVPPYLGLQLFAFVASRQARLAERESGARERLRIARELHDALGHHLTALALNLEVARHQTDGPARESVTVAQSLARLLLADLREIAHAMHPGTAPDLKKELLDLARDLPAPRVHVEMAEDLNVGDARRALALLRCAQESVTNAARHGAAPNVWIAVRRNGREIELVARDDGRGAAMVREGGGLRGLRERLGELGGALHVEAGGAPGRGFTLRATLRDAAEGAA